MLLHSVRRAAPKARARRSRGGCVNCKEKKKKCNELRPRCGRCAEKDINCSYQDRRPRIEPMRDTTSSLNWQQTSSVWDASSYVPEAHGCGISHDARSSVIVSCGFTNMIDGVNTNRSTGPPWTLLAKDKGGSRQHSCHDRRPPPYRHSLDSRRPSFISSAAFAPSTPLFPLRTFCPAPFIELSPHHNRRYLISHFCSVLSRLIVFREDTGNPFRQLVLPLSQSAIDYNGMSPSSESCSASHQHDSPVMNAIYALSSAHLEHRGVQNVESSVVFHNAALQSLAALIEKDEPIRREEGLAAIILLVYYEVLVQKDGSSMVAEHLKAALTLLEMAAMAQTTTGIFLRRAFMFYDVISALSWGKRPTPISKSARRHHESETRRSSSVMARRRTNLTHDLMGDIDTLLGMATELWPLIHQLADLIADKESLLQAKADGELAAFDILITNLRSSCGDLEQALLTWQPPATCDTLTNSFQFGFQMSPLEISTSIDTSWPSHMLSILHNAEAYRHAALVVLYGELLPIIQSFDTKVSSVSFVANALPLPNEGSALLDTPAATSVRQSEYFPKLQQHTTFALRFTLQTCHHLGPTSALLWPLFIAACEAVTTEDREVAQLVFHSCEARQGMVNIGVAWRVVQQLWEQRNEAFTKDAAYDIDHQGVMNVGWRAVASEMRVRLVLG